jgi:hypothetical protein
VIPFTRGNKLTFVVHPAAGAKHGFPVHPFDRLRSEFKKRRHLFIRTHAEALTAVAMRVCGEDDSPVGINR